jgi:hypothetical protein
MKKSFVFLCVWLIFLGIVGAAKAILYTISDDRDHFPALEFNTDQFRNDMAIGAAGHGAHRSHDPALWDEGRRYRHWVHRGWRGLYAGRHQYPRYASWTEEEPGIDAAETGMQDPEISSDSDWQNAEEPNLDDIAGYVAGIPPAVSALNPAPTPESTAPVPEPATLVLVGAGLIGIAALKKKKSAKSK